MGKTKTKRAPKSGAAATHIKTLLGLGMSPEGIADAMAVGVQSIKRWEAGTHFPQPGNLRRLAELAEQKKNAKA